MPSLIRALYVSYVEGRESDAVKTASKEEKD
jgi:hypothetical protein